MKRYELKDKERQAALEKVFPGFGRLLDEACAVCPNDTIVNVSRRGVAGQDLPYFYELSFVRSTIEEVVAYDPKGWNDYPKVTPPKGVPMRVEYTVPLMTVFRRGGIAVFEDGHWYECTPCGRHKISQFKNGRRVVRFRPWDDEI